MGTRMEHRRKDEQHGDDAEGFLTAAAVYFLAAFCYLTSYRLR